MKPTPPTAAVANAPTHSRGAQVALSVFLAVLLGLLALRGYGNRLGARPTQVVTADLTDLNTADQHELSQVPGVGPKTAEAIVDHRRVHGLFKSVDELNNVRGIGTITLEKLRAQFRVSAVPRTEYAEPQRSLQPLAPPKFVPTRTNKIQPGEPPIDINSATRDELLRLPNIGPVTAQNIIATRAITPFQTVNDLDKVKGIGPKTLEKLRPFVVVK